MRVERVLLKDYTTLGVGGPAELWTVETPEDLKKATEAPYRVLGNGSNLLVMDEGVEERELVRAKKMVRAQTVQGLAKNFFRGLLVGLFHLKTGDARRVNHILEYYESVTREDLVRVARHYLREDNRTVVILRPVSPEESQALGPLA